MMIVMFVLGSICLFVIAAKDADKTRGKYVGIAAAACLFVAGWLMKQ